ncbi:CPBP family intramembrane metalloprotease [Xenorhabdus bovienii]|uniref:CAAX prenyl protease 2/Lysostaphin resistance protein A-like domain-containing protein n=1 Tax=Xenorhabdus bovienii str. kraussei Quebec TaxID=1398203 RepID=A0A077PD44_XENBV|nr:CPBP family intramembrane glutamic endopeptidase [Xenorhabdus bovienii]MDE1487936.1 CPBP family intramembrane metalloprotease [Xenorhabdus bovienii]MDE1495976.1 CPBP family intramembrane metalloprotease [Xenorhabdus bovienii]MDE9471686.1 CPBP family intramembrane metalloprotease [Xenorhabdus bovienii]MDE9478846.1 CPBP family intramembrane metalloprotease [Xenorhabdus bovienii]MDE9531618.1 CPBP family intramembrane metalloprotease [Xenorhabdus bovienii]
MSWALLAVSLALLDTRRIIAFSIAFLALIIGISTNVLTFPAVAALTVIAGLGTAHVYLKKHPTFRIITEVLLLISVVLLFMHYIPGFNNLKYLDKVQVGPLSAPFSMYFNFDKALIPFILLFCMPSLFTRKPVAEAFPHVWAALIVAIPALLGLATELGGLAVELHLPNWFPAFVVANIFFVSLAEEALFRGYLQQKLSQLINPYLALVITSLIFGAAHFAGGSLLMIFATLAGLIYGLAWMWSGRLWVAVAFHVSLNLGHLLFFTYPVKSLLIQ